MMRYAFGKENSYGLDYPARYSWCGAYRKAEKPVSAVYMSKIVSSRPRQGVKHVFLATNVQFCTRIIPFLISLSLLSPTLCLLPPLHLSLSLSLSRSLINCPGPKTSLSRIIYRPYIYIYRYIGGRERERETR